MFPFIYTERNGIHILDLVQTAKLLTQAGDFLQTAAENGKKFLFVGTKKQAASIISQEAKAFKKFYVNHRWLGGMLTNWETIKQRIDQMIALEEQEANGTLDKLPKKELPKKRKELENLRLHLGGIRDMDGRPDVMIVIDQQKEITAVREAITLNIPIVSLLDTNCDPDLVDIPIPANDDTISSVKYILEYLADRIAYGYEVQSNTDNNLKENKQMNIQISPQTVKELREKTGAGMMNCKKALEQSDGDFDKAMEALRQKGLASAEKKSARAVSEGIIDSYIHTGSKIGVLLEINCETDFVARREEFKELSRMIAMQVAAYPTVNYVSYDDIPESVIEEERKIEMGKEDLQSKPEEIRAKIVEGRIEKLFKAQTLLDQPYMKDAGITVDELVKQNIGILGENIQISRFTRFTLGE